MINGTFCVLPWIHLYVGPNGDVLPCCQADHSLPLGNVDNHSITAILQSPTATHLKQNMVAGKPSNECQRCYDLERHGLRSERQIQNQVWEGMVESIIADPGAISPPVYLDIRLSNLCNLKCRMCSSYFSSAIQQEEKEIWGDDQGNKAVTYFKKKQRDFALTEILSFMSHTEKIYFAGGEPLLSSEHYEILQQLIDIDRTNVDLIYNTNLTNFKYKTLNVLDYWKKFKKVTVMASLDAQGEVAEYVRHGTSWTSILDNLQMLRNQCDHVTVKITSAVGFMNIYSLMEMQKTCKLVDINNFYLSMLISPAHLTLQVLPQHHKNNLAQAIDQHVAWCVDQGAMQLSHEWTNAKQFMFAQDCTNQLLEFKRITQLLDSHRNESFADVLPQFKDLVC
jgi:radical SAM protein with 4Fe4S-binding SPASM domain